MVKFRQESPLAVIHDYWRHKGLHWLFSLHTRIDMTNDLLEAAKVAVQQSAGPMTVRQIVAAVAEKMEVPNKKAFPAEIRKALPGEAGIHVWPAFRGSPVFCSRPLSACVEEALLPVLDEKPLASTKEAKKSAGKAVMKALRYVSEDRAVKEIDVLLPQLATSGRIVRLAANRQSGIYVTRSWMAKQAGTEKDVGEGSLAAIIPAVVERLQSGPGNYVRVDHLRMAPEIRAVLDEQVIRLADEGKLVLGRYDGPLPVPEAEGWAYVEDEMGELFIGVALPRNAEANS